MLNNLSDLSFNNEFVKIYIELTVKLITQNNISEKNLEYLFKQLKDYKMDPFNIESISNLDKIILEYLNYPSENLKHPLDYKFYLAFLIYSKIKLTEILSNLKNLNNIPINKLKLKIGNVMKKFYYENNENLILSFTNSNAKFFITIPQNFTPDKIKNNLILILQSLLNLINEIEIHIEKLVKNPNLNLSLLLNTIKLNLNLFLRNFKKSNSLEKNFFATIFLITWIVTILNNIFKYES